MPIARIASDVTANPFPTGVLQPRAVGQSRRSASLDALARLRRATLTPEQEAADAREQQAIADAVEGVIP